MSTKSQSFYLQNWATHEFVIRNDGQGSNQYGFAIRDANRRAEYYLEFVEGAWGYLTIKDTDYVLQPESGGVSAGKGTCLKFGNDRNPGSFFTLGQNMRTIMHVSGLFLRPTADDPNFAGVELSDVLDLTAKFCATDGNGKDVSIPLPAHVSIGWNLLYSLEDAKTDQVHTIKRTVGQTVTYMDQSMAEKSLKLGIELELFGLNSSASEDVKTAYSHTDQGTWSEQIEETSTHNIKKGDSVAVWQRSFLWLIALSQVRLNVVSSPC